MEAPVGPLRQSNLRLSDLATRQPTPFELTPNAEERRAAAEVLGITGIKKLKFSGHIAPLNSKDWELSADLGATIIQECVVTLDPVTTRLDEKITRRYVSEIEEIEANEIEMPEDDTVEALPVNLDLVQVMTEALSLALPLYPRADGADLGEAVFTQPNTAPMTDDDAKPFAGLGALRDSLENKGE